MSKFQSEVKSFFAQTRQMAQEAAVGLAEQALNRILVEGPQFSGDFTANWRVGIGTPFNRFEYDALHFRKREAVAEDTGGSVEPYKKGDMPAIQYAMKNAAPRLAHMKTWPLGNTIYLTNDAYHDQPYNWMIEKGQIDFRPENPNADRVVQRAAFFVRNRFKHIGKPQLAALRKVGV